MRLVGPNCFGIAIPPLGLNATFAGAEPPPGSAGLVVQSGGIGIAVLEHLTRLGIGVSSFASVGDKFDVSSNDMLMWWEQDKTTKLALLYVESFGSPRRFAQTARRVGRQFPVLTVIGGRSAAGQRAAASHTAAAATPLVTQEALFGQAGVIATTSLGELVDAAALLACQPLPAGNRVAIVSNAGGAGVLAADACGDNDLKVATLSDSHPAAAAQAAAQRRGRGRPGRHVGGRQPAGVPVLPGAGGQGRRRRRRHGDHRADRARPSRPGHPDREADQAARRRHARPAGVGQPAAPAAAPVPTRTPATTCRPRPARRYLPTCTRRALPARSATRPATAPGGPSAAGTVPDAQRHQAGRRAADRGQVPGRAAPRRLAAARPGLRPARLLRDQPGADARGGQPRGRRPRP